MQDSVGKLKGMFKDYYMKTADEMTMNGYLSMHPWQRGCVKREGQCIISIELYDGLDELASESTRNESEDMINSVIKDRRNVDDTPKPKGELPG